MGPTSGHGARGSRDRSPGKEYRFPEPSTISRKGIVVRRGLLTGPRSVCVSSTVLDHFFTADHAFFSPCLADHSIMYPSRCVLLLALADHFATGLSLPATIYDQRQTGDLNVQVHLKDVQVLALLDTELLDDYTEYDYIYDYADFTIKPISKPTTTAAPAPSVSSTTEKLTEVSNSLSENSTFVSNSTEEGTTVSPDASQTNVTLAVSSNEHLENSTSEEKAPKRIGDPSENDEEDATRRSNRGSSGDVSSKRLSGKRCRSGYSPDGKGRCRRQSQRKLSLIPLAMKLTPRLFDDLIGLNTRNSMKEKDVDQIHSN